ncbi:MAG: glucose-1-phosphate adenylyltransferase subunit GlgD, partial [Anaerotignum sp.]|nr:glucose-1-phosphate adenylyltransferase subunit GlgD [Anaerotignum sp.]
CRFEDGGNAKNSLIADGCVIEGSVENSILFRGVHVQKGAVVKNSILMQDATVGEDTQLNCVIADKNVQVLKGRLLSGHSTHPYFITRDSIV